ncbi:MAG: tetratricopeptide repeat protein, partial [Planctomycetota bacterium]
MLLQQARPEEARRLLLRVATERPGDAEVHLLLAYAHSAANEHDAAEEHARRAIVLAPDEAACHAALARVLTGASRRRGEALAAALTAVGLDPADPDNHALVAVGHVGQKQWNLALEAADEGLALDPEHGESVNLRAIALRGLGRAEQASRVLGQQLGRTPNDAWTHSNQGWTLLHRGDYAGAQRHFREALALDPNCEPARLGIREALQARHWLYRPILRFFLWIGAFEGRKQFAILIGGWLLYSVGVQFTTSAVLPVQIAAIVFVAAYLLFAAGTWFARSFAAASLAFHPLGRLALTRMERRFGLAISASVLVAAALLALGLLGGRPLLVAPAVLLGCVAAVARAVPELGAGNPP